MSEQRSNPGAVAGPKCPSCSSRMLSYTEVLGPAESVFGTRFRADMARLSKEFAPRLASVGARQLSPEEQKRVGADPNHVSKQARDQARDDRQANLHQEFEQARQQLLRKYTDPRCMVAVVHCAACGHVIGTADSPAARILASDRLESAITALLHAMSGLQAATGGVQRQVAAVNSREESRDRVAQFNASAAALRNMLGE